MTREQYIKFGKEKLLERGHTEWGMRISTDASKPFVGLCSYKDKLIILNAHHLDIHPEVEVIDTILHEIAHIETPFHGHDDVWKSKAIELGCKNLGACPEIPAHIVDAIRSGDLVEVEYEEFTEVKRIPKYKVTRIQEKCPVCERVAVEKSSEDVMDKDGNCKRVITLECGHAIEKLLPKQTPFWNMVSNFWKDEVEICEHKWAGTKCLNCGEFRLFQFQVEGAKFAEAAIASYKGVGIFDEMGLGKTVQCLAYIKYHIEESLPILFVLKSGLKYQVASEILRWLGPDYIPQILTTAKERFLPGMGTYIISYDLLRRMPPEKMTMQFKLVVLDECQQIKNPDSTRTQQVRKLLRNPDTKVIALSGTPWKNRGSEFFPVLNMLDPMKFSSHAGFIKRWVDYYWEGTKRKEGGIINIPQFKEYVKNIIVRRERTEVMSELPLINRTKLNFELDDIEKQTYNEEVGEFVKWYNSYVMEGREDEIDSLQLLAKMTRMKHIVGLAKIPATLAFVEEFIEDSENKLVIFVHHKDVGQIMYSSLTDTSNPQWGELAQTLKDLGIKVEKLTADLTSEERYNLQVRFNQSKRSILIASTLASGEGLNLQTCSDCIMHERQWNPANEEQAEGRFIRIGQTAQSVNATYVEANGTIDSQSDAIVEKKRAYIHEVMNKGEAPVWNQSSFVKELAESIVAKFKKDNSGKKYAKV